MARVAAIYRYPIKGLSPESLARVDLAAGECLPLDRRFALARPNAAFDPKAPRWLSKTNFLMLMKDERLAEFDAAYDDDRGRLAIRHRGESVLDEDIRTEAGRKAVEDFFYRFMDVGLEAPPRLVEAPGHAFTDSSQRYVSLINLETLRALEGAVGQPVHPLRFRANLYVDDLPAWGEFDWVGKELAIDGGAVGFEAAARIDRCAATAVHPATGARDLNVPLALRRHFGHIDCGVYLRVTAPGRLTVGDVIA
jgi:uncharacterized protein YcbX